ncbi:MAG: wax ester/triacylglycerol synthase domain-containing protein [Mycobacterium sp.]
MTATAPAAPGRRPLGIQDALWLDMDRPTNIMVADVAVWTTERVNSDAFQVAIIERLVERYPVFCSKAVSDENGNWCWEPDPDFDIGNHISIAALPDPDDPRSMHALVAAHRTEMLNRNRPLWEVIWVERYRGGSAMILRTHHALADGMRLVQLAMSLFDASPEGGAILGPAVAQHGAQPHLPRMTLRQRVRSVAVESIAVTRTAGRQPMTALSESTSRPRRQKGHHARLGRFALRNPLGALHATLHRLRRTAVEMRRSLPRGGTLAGVVSALPGNADTIRKFVVGTRNHPTIWTGPASGSKGVSWSPPLPLSAVKAVAKAHGCTVNDVLVATVASALHGYLRSQDAHCGSVAFMVPVNLKPLDLSLPETLGNEFALVQLELPTDEPDPIKVLAIARRRMNRIKSGNEAAIAFRLQETISGLSRTLYETSVELFTNRTLGVLTNVPGPPIPVYLAGALVEGIAGWAPVSGDQPMSFSICSYNGEVVVGIACDTELVPGYEAIVDGFVVAFDRLVAQTPGAGSIMGG